MSREYDRKQYNQIAEAYVQYKKSPHKEHVIKPNALRHCKPIRGQRILDIGCGSGYFSRLFAEMGAELVAGMDISGKEIDIAKKIEAETHLGIEYHAGDLADFDFLSLNQRFDLISAINILHYAENREELCRFVAGPSGVLVPGGRFVAMVENPDSNISGNKYVRMTPTSRPVKSGAPLYIELLDDSGKTFADFYTFHWNKEDYEEAFDRAGLLDFECCNLVPEKGSGLEPDSYNTLAIVKARK